MKKPFDRQPMYVQELFKKMKSDENNKPFFKCILNDVFKQPFTITKMYNKNPSLLCNNRDYKALTKGTQYIIIEYHSNDNEIGTIYVGIKGNKGRNKGIFYNGIFNPYGYTGVGWYGTYPSSTFYMITL